MRRSVGPAALCPEPRRRRRRRIVERIWNWNHSKRVCAVHAACWMLHLLHLYHDSAVSRSHVYAVEDSFTLRALAYLYLELRSWSGLEDLLSGKTCTNRPRSTESTSTAALGLSVNNYSRSCKGELLRWIWNLQLNSNDCTTLIFRNNFGAYIIIYKYHICQVLAFVHSNFMVFPSGKNNGITVLINGHQIAQVHY